MWISKRRFNDTMQGLMERVARAETAQQQAVALVTTQLLEASKVAGVLKNELEELRTSRFYTEGQLAEVSKARDFAVTSFEWMKTQLSQLTWERNKLMEQLTAVPARKLEFGTESRQTDGKTVGKDEKTGTPIGDSNRYTPGASFLDIGDEEAARVGIDLKPALEEIEQLGQS